MDNLKELLQFENGPDGIEMTVSKEDGIQVSLKDGKGSIVYKEKCHFFRWTIPQKTDSEKKHLLL